MSLVTVGYIYTANIFISLIIGLHFQQPTFVYDQSDIRNHFWAVPEGALI